jgi:hypothetical protein
MNSSPASSSPTGEQREIASRENDGLHVQLLWGPVLDTLMLCVEDERTEVIFELPVERTRGLEAFHHPFAYAAEEADVRAKRATVRVRRTSGGHAMRESLVAERSAD